MVFGGSGSALLTVFAKDGDCGLVVVDHPKGVLDVDCWDRDTNRTAPRGTHQYLLRRHCYVASLWSP